MRRRRDDRDTDSALRAPRPTTLKKPSAGAPLAVVLMNSPLLSDLDADEIQEDIEALWATSGTPTLRSRAAPRGRPLGSTLTKRWMAPAAGPLALCDRRLDTPVD
jgi:hypothetical protein